MRLRGTSLLVLGAALALVAACGKKEQEQQAAAPAATEQAAPVAAPGTYVPAGNLDACKLVTADEVKEATGLAVQGPSPNKTNPTVCEFVVGDGGVMNWVAKTANPTETPEKMLAETREQKYNPVEKTGIGDAAFFASPGYGMVQLNAFKSGKYAIVTMMVSGKSEADQKAIAEKLMKKALERL